MSLWRIALVTLLCALAPVSGAPAEDRYAPDEATQVGYARIMRSGSYDWRIACTSTGEVRDVALAFGVELNDGSFSGWDRLFSSFSRTGGIGSVLQVDGAAAIDEPPGARGPSQLRSFSRWGRVSVDDAARAHLTWATWGGRMDCEVTVGDTEIPTFEPERARAFYVGPQGFRGGAFVQHGSARASVARAYAAKTSGGIVMAHLTTGLEVDYAAVVTDDPSESTWPRCSYYDCRSMSMRATTLVALLGATVEIHTGAPSAELWVIDLGL